MITVASFVAATAYTQKQLGGLDALSSTIETNSVPSIEYLSRAAVRLTRLNQQLSEITAAGADRASAIAAAREDADALSSDVDRYLRLSPLPGEQAFWTQLRTDINRAVQLIDADLEERSPAAQAAKPTADQVDDALDAALRSVSATLDFDVRQSQAMARDVRTVRAKTLRTIVGLDLVATLIAAATVIIAHRAARRHDQLVDEHDALLTARVSELDRFAGRVAHDVMSPLGTVATGLALIAHSCDERARPYIDRSERALQRVQLLVNDLLAFARAGARPDPTSNCDLAAVLPAAVADCLDAAVQNSIEIITRVDGSARVACTSGVITSVVQNLVRNAIKYLGERPVKRVVIRTAVAGDFVRVEVEDTGPGIPSEIRTTLFEPFVRGPREHASGTGLGLATVKRLVQSHGGRVGVESKPEVGTLFWIELPTAPETIGSARHDVELHHV